jgi:hypothetical protein
MSVPAGGRSGRRLPVALEHRAVPAGTASRHSAACGDITAGDPAADLAVAWMLLPAAARLAFRAAYAGASRHGANQDLWDRARGWALALALVFLAHSADNPMMARMGQQTLAAVLG